MKAYYIYILFILLLSCKTEEPQTSPTVRTVATTNITLNKATIGGEVVSEGFTAASERGFVLSDTKTNPSVVDTKYLIGYGIGSFSKDLDNLKVNTKYYYAAFATNTKGTSYGEILNFTTADYKLATLSFEAPKNITFTSVQLTSTVSEDGGVAVSERGFVLGTSPNPTVANTKIQNGNGLGSFSTVVTQLKEETIFYSRAYAINGKGTAYSSETSFTTLGYKTPTLETGYASSIGASTAILNGDITNTGGIDLIEKGFVFGLNTNVGLNDQKAISSTKDGGKYSIVITNLKTNTKYYYKSYAINSKGTTLGQENSFSTLVSTIPSVSTNDFANITEVSVRTGLEVANDGGSKITEYGVCISSSNSFPSISDRKIIFGTSINAFPYGEMNEVRGLTALTNYYVRGYAANSNGVAYGNTKSFTTSSNLSNNLKNGLLAYYPFNGNTNDISGNGNNGTNIGATLTTDRFNTINSSYYFSAINCSPRIEAFVNTNSITNSLTISIWVLKIGDGCSSPRILDFASDPINGPGQIQMTYGYNNSWGLGHLKSNGTELFSSLFPHGQIKWTHLVYTNDGAQARFYQDGNLLKLVSNGTGNPVLAKNLIIGRMNHPAFDAFDGKIDDVGIWNRALSADEVKYLYQNNFQP